MPTVYSTRCFDPAVRRHRRRLWATGSCRTGCANALHWPDLRSAEDSHRARAAATPDHGAIMPEIPSPMHPRRRAAHRSGVRRRRRWRLLRSSASRACALKRKPQRAIDHLQRLFCGEIINYPVKPLILHKAGRRRGNSRADSRHQHSRHWLLEGRRQRPRTTDTAAPAGCGRDCTHRRRQLDRPAALYSNF